MNWEIRHVNHESSDAEKEQVSKYWEGLYTWMTASRLEKPWGDETYGFAAAFTDDDTVIATTSYAISKRGQAILSQVHTEDSCRKQGIGAAVISECIETFKRNGARAAYLASWAQWIRNIYLKRGFVNVGNMGQRGAFKLTINDSGSDDNLFRAGQQTGIRPLAIDDQQDLTSLFCAKHNCVVKNYELGNYLGSYFEGEFYVLQNQTVEGVIPEERRPKTGYRALVLDGEETIMGLGTVIPSSRRHEGHTGIIDFLVHRHYSDRTAELIEQLEADCELDHLTAYIETHEDDKRALLKNAGYSLLTGLGKQLLIGEEAFDLEMWGKGF